MDHPNAEMYFERDVGCVKDYLRRKHAIDFETSLTFAKAFEAYRRNCPPEEKAKPEGGYAMPAKPKKVEVSLGAKEDAALMGAIDSATSLKADAEEEEDDEDEDEEEAEEGAKFSPPRRTAGPEFVPVRGVEAGDDAEAGDATASAEE